MYQFPGFAHFEYPRDQVINHRRVVKRGHRFDGLLLGSGYESIPAVYRHGANIDASLALIDEMGRDFSTSVKLWVNRGVKIDRPRRKKTTRAPLFEKRDGAKGELIQK
jgi:hypothetical protein